MRSTSSSSSARSWSTRASARRSSSISRAAAQLASGRPPRYAGTCRELQRRRRSRCAAPRGAARACAFECRSGSACEFEDLVHGPQSFLSDDIGDFIVRREDGTAAFFFSNALDDALHARQSRAARRGSPEQYAAPAAAARGAGAAGAALWPRVAADRRRRRAAVQAARRDERCASCARPAYARRGRLQSAVPARSLERAQRAADARSRWRRRSSSSHLQRAPAHFDAVAPGVIGSANGCMRSRREQARAWLAPVLPRELDARADAAPSFARCCRTWCCAEDARLWQQIIFGEALSYEEPALRAARRPVRSSSRRRPAPSRERADP